MRIFRGSCTFAGTGDVTGSDPGVPPSLGSNGGPTPTHALLWNSPAIDARDLAGCSDAFGVAPAIDQRGVPRSEGGLCDIGAFEFQDQIFHDGFGP